MAVPPSPSWQGGMKAPKLGAENKGTRVKQQKRQFGPRVFVVVVTFGRADHPLLPAAHLVRAVQAVDLPVTHVGDVDAAHLVGALVLLVVALHGRPLQGLRLLQARVGDRLVVVGGPALSAGVQVAVPAAGSSGRAAAPAPTYVTYVKLARSLHS